MGLLSKTVPNKIGWAIADAVGFKIIVDDKNFTIRGGEDIEVKICGGGVVIPAKIVSSRVTEPATMVVLKLIGNLAALVVVKEVKGSTITDLHLLNLAKMDAAEEWLEKHQPESVNVALDRLKPAVVAHFTKRGDYHWKEA